MPSTLRCSWTAVAEERVPSTEAKACVFQQRIPNQIGARDMRLWDVAERAIYHYYREHYCCYLIENHHGSLPEWGIIVDLVLSLLIKHQQGRESIKGMTLVPADFTHLLPASALFVPSN